jgi:radical SAM PhpK family P-methyltransferase
MHQVDCLLIGHYALSVNKQIQIAEVAFGKNSLYYFDALEKTFITHEGRNLTSSQLYNLFYSNGSGDPSFDHVTFEHSFNTAIANIGTYLVRNGVSIDFVNTFNQGRQALPDMLARTEYLAVAIPTTFYVSALPIAQIVRFIRSRASRPKIVVGGPFVKNVATTYSKDPAQLGRMFDSMGADYYVSSSDGEQTLLLLIQALKSGADVGRVPNVYYRSAGAYVFTGSKPERHTYGRSMVEWSLFRDHIPELVNVRTSKSCPFDCAFCGLPVTGGKWKSVPVEQTELELNELHADGRHPGVFFIDETLNFPPRKFNEMLRMIIRNGYGLKWEGELRCNTLDRETVKLMADSGCQMVHLGIESGSQQVLDKMSKRVQLDEYYRALDLLNEFDIMSTALILVGFPGETEATFQETFDFIESRRPTLFRVHRWFYDHDTPIQAQRERYSIEGGGYQWKHSTMDAAKAHELATHLSLSVRNSIHTDDYSMAFYLANKGYPQTKVVAFLRAFDNAVKDKCRSPAHKAAPAGYIEQLKAALT